MSAVDSVQCAGSLDPGPAGGGRIAFDPPFVLAPMEGITHRVFRDVLIAGGGVGAAFTEFIRVAGAVVGPAALRRELGPARGRPPVGVQLMGSDPGRIAATARNAERAGAPMIDLNFGCPAPIVFRKCAGSALLADPDRIRAIVAAACAAVSVPVTAKIRVGITDASGLPAIVRAVEEGGAAALTVHARTKADGFSRPARWEWLRAARSLTRLPLIGNGDVATVEDAFRMRRETGVDAVMIGRGVLSDPLIFRRIAARSRGEDGGDLDAAAVFGFWSRYRDAMLAEAPESVVLSCLKQLVRRLDAGLRIPEAERFRWLRTGSLLRLDADFAAFCGGV